MIHVYINLHWTTLVLWFFEAKSSSRSFLWDFSWPHSLPVPTILIYTYHIYPQLPLQGPNHLVRLGGNLFRTETHNGAFNTTQHSPLKCTRSRCSPVSCQVLIQIGSGNAKNRPAVYHSSSQLKFSQVRCNKTYHWTESCTYYIFTVEYFKSCWPESPGGADWAAERIRHKKILPLITWSVSRCALAIIYASDMIEWLTGWERPLLKTWLTLWLSAARFYTQ